MRSNTPWAVLAHSRQSENAGRINGCIHEGERMKARVDISAPQRAGQRKSGPRHRVVWRSWFRDKWISEVARDTSISIGPNIHAAPWSPASDFASLHPLAPSPWGETAEKTEKRVQPTAPLSVWWRPRVSPFPVCLGKSHFNFSLHFSISECCSPRRTAFSGCLDQYRIFVLSPLLDPRAEQLQNLI